MLILVFFISISTTGGFTGVNTNISPQALPSTINTCVLIPQTGFLSFLSPAVENAANIANQELNAQYPTYNWNTTFYDTQTDPATATTQMTQAVDDGCAFVAGAFGSRQTLSAAVVANNSQVPLITYGSTSPDLRIFNDHAVMGDEGYVWGIPATDERQSEAMSDFAKLRGYTKAAIVLMNDWLVLNDTLTSTFTSSPNSGQIVTSISYDPLSYNANSIVSDVKASNADVVFLISYEADGSDLIVEMANQNLNIPIIGWEGIGANSIYTQSPQTPAAMQNVTSTIFGYDWTYPSISAFVQTYNTQYPGQWGVFAGEAYDSLWIGALAVLAADSTLGSDIIKELAQTDFDGGSGHIEFDSDGHVFDATYDVYKAQGSSYLKIAQWKNGELKFDRIAISNNDHFLMLGFPGSGTISDPYRLENMELDNTLSVLIVIFFTTAHFVIENNVLNGYGSTTEGILLNNVQNGIVRDNIVSGNGAGINLQASTNIIINNNDVFNNSVGISLEPVSDFNTISNNNLHENEDGMTVSGANSNTITDNRFEDNNNGINVQFTSNDNIIENNEFDNNDGTGIYVSGSTGNTISGNWFINNGDGAFDFGPTSSSNTITLNDFIDTGGPNQGNDHGLNNHFTTNFWSNNVDPDLDGNGYVDQASDIDGDAHNNDEFPLTWPVHPNEILFILPITITNPNSGIISGDVTIEWTASKDTLNSSIVYSIYYSIDFHETWIELTSDYTQTTFTFKSNIVENGEIWIKIVAHGELSLETETILGGIIIDNTVDPDPTTTTTSDDDPTSEDEETSNPSILNYYGFGLFIMIPVGFFRSRKKYRR